MTAKVTPMKKQDYAVDELKTAMAKARQQIEIAVQDISYIASEPITHRKKNAALWLVQNRLEQAVTSLEKASTQAGKGIDDIPF